MGMYLNPKNKIFSESKNSEIYVDKSMLINNLNKIINTLNKFICVSRPRRFGKSVDANMLVAYYSKGCNSSEIFDDLKISQCESYHQHLNKHNVIHLNMQNFLSLNSTIEELINDLNDSLIEELLEEYPLIKQKNLMKVLNYTYLKYNEGFIFIIDEWDCIFRVYKEDIEQQKAYLDYLRLLFKDQPYIDLVYMTGILPIKKYGTHSALNMFDEISMIDFYGYENFMGFTETEVKHLCNQYSMDFEQMKIWYDGYQLNSISCYCPRSVVKAIEKKKLINYWTKTETFEALKIYIDLNIEGLKDDVIRMLSDEEVEIDISSFQNDMVECKSKDDVFTLLVHLGYLTYNEEMKTVKIPNKEVKGEFATSIKNSNWQISAVAIQNSRKLLNATINQKADEVANYIEQAHLETSILQYNDENALAYTLYLAYYSARDYYTLVRELPSGKGFADLVLIPYKNDKPAMIIELKYDEDANSAIKQIKDKKYYFGLEKYLDHLLLIGINYDKVSKKHTCIIEKYKK